ncbi:hypothetical protein Dimus_025401 [Dionaea muscipula]
MTKEPQAKMKAAPLKSSAHPPFFGGISDVNVTSEERTGSSQYAIQELIEEKHKQLPSNFRKLIVTGSIEGVGGWWKAVPGLVRLSNIIELKTILIIPSLTCNLFSVSQVTRTLTWMYHFMKVTHFLPFLLVHFRVGVLIVKWSLTLHDDRGQGEPSLIVHGEAEGVIGVYGHVSGGDNLGEGTDNVLHNDAIDVLPFLCHSQTMSHLARIFVR